MFSRLQHPFQVIKDEEIFYTVYDDHVIVGNGTTLQQNAIVPGEKPTKLILQDQVNGIDVTEISDYAFYNYLGVTEIKLPSKLKIINNNAFDMLGYSGTITFPETLEYIGRRAFAVSSFSSINIPA